MLVRLRLLALAAITALIGTAAFAGALPAQAVGGPTANPDVAHTESGLTAHIDVLANDTQGDGTRPPDKTALSYPADGQPTGAEQVDYGTAMRIPGVGFFAGDDKDNLTFEAAPGYVGSFRVSYQWFNAKTMESGRSTVDITVDPPISASDATIPVDPSEGNAYFRLADHVHAPTGVSTTYSIEGSTWSLPGQGQWYLSSDGTGVFVARYGFRGTTTPITYRVTDSWGGTATGTLVAAVYVPLTAVADDATIRSIGQSVQIPVLANDSVDPDYPLIDGGVSFAAQQPEGARWVDDHEVVTDEGRLRLDPVTHVVTLWPSASVAATVRQPVTYQLKDTAGRTSKGTINVGYGLDAHDDSAHTATDNELVIPVVDNDLEPDGSLVSADSGVKVTISPEDQRLNPDPGADPPGSSFTGTGFIPLPDNRIAFYAGSAFFGSASVLYTITDSHGRSSRATVTVTVERPPTATDATATGLAGHDVGVDLSTHVVLPNGGAATYSFSWDDGPFQGSFSDDANHVTLSGQGVWTLVGGIASFTPQPGWSGTTRPVFWRVTSAAGGKAQAQLTAVVHAAPVAVPDSQSVLLDYHNSGVVHVLDNDVFDSGAQPPAGAVTFPQFVQPAGVTWRGPHVVETAGATYYTDPNDSSNVVHVIGNGSHAPSAGTVVYSVADGDGTSVTAPLSPTLVYPLVANDDTVRTESRSAHIQVLANDRTTDGDTESVPTIAMFTVRIAQQGQPSGAQPSSGNLLVIPGAGAFIADGLGGIDFNAADGFTGTVSALYQVFDPANGYSDTAKVTVTVDVAVTAANVDRVTTPATRLYHDLAGGVTLADGVTATGYGFVESEDPDPTRTRPTLSTREGNWRIDGSLLTFIPEGDFHGITAPVTYRVTDSDGGTADAIIKVAVLAAPQAKGVTFTAQRGSSAAVTVPVLDRATFDELAPFAGLTFPVEGNPSAAYGDDATTITTSDGTYRFDVTTSKLTFTPSVSLGSSPAVPVTYRVTDSYGRTSTATITPRAVTGVRTSNDSARTQVNTRAVVHPLTNDLGANDVGLDPETLAFASSGQPQQASISAEGRVLNVPGQGSWEISNSAQTITFRPEVDYRGPVDPISYTVSDLAGATGTATVTVTIDEQLLPGDDSGVTWAGHPVTTDVLTNDEHDPATTLVPSSVTLRTVTVATETIGFDLSQDLRTMNVHGQGTYQVTDAGAITFTPAAGFVGVPEPIGYCVQDSDTGVACGQLQITVYAALGAQNATGSTHEGQGQTFIVLPSGDGPNAAPVDTGSVRFSATGQPAGATVASTRTSITVKGQGSYVVHDDGTIGFLPADGFHGTASAVAFTFASTDGQTGVAGTLTVTVLVGPTASDDKVSTPYAHAVTAEVLGNDHADATTPFDSSSLLLISDRPTVRTSGQLQPRGIPGHTTVTVAGQGTYTAKNGRITFTPVAGFSGAATPMRYLIFDSSGLSASARLTVTVGVAPKAYADTASTRSATPVRVVVLKNDTADKATSLVASSVRFAATGQPAGSRRGADGRSLSVSKQGTWIIDSRSGSVVFTPAVGFAGTTSPIVYTVADGNGNTAGASVRVTVASDRVVAAFDRATTPWNRSVSVDVLGNDRATSALTSGSLLFPATGQPAGRMIFSAGHRMVVPGQGTYTIGNGRVTFTPLASVSGRVLSPVRYQVADAAGSIGTGTLVVGVGIAPAASASSDSGSGFQGHAVTVNVLANDKASTGARLIPRSVVLTGAVSRSARTRLTDGGRTLVVAGQGTYTVNASGTITFRPGPTFVGTTTPVSYEVFDSNGRTASGTLRVTISQAIAFGSGR